MCFFDNRSSRKIFWNFTKDLRMKGIIKSGTTCFISKLGHNNFFYPIKDETGLTTFLEDVDDYSIKSWICGDPNLKAVEVRAITLSSMVCPPDARTVVWIDTRKVKIL